VLLSWLIAASVVAQSQRPQAAAPNPSARVAAFTFAITSDWQFPRTNVIVAVDTHFGGIDGHPVIQSAAVVNRENREIAALLGTEVRTGRAADYLSCPSPGVCFAKTDQSVILVGGLFQGDSDVLIRVYTPGPNGKDRTSHSSTTSAIVQLKRWDSGWVATEYSKPPTTHVRPR